MNRREFWKSLVLRVSGTTAFLPSVLFAAKIASPKKFGPSCVWKIMKWGSPNWLPIRHGACLASFWPNQKQSVEYAAKYWARQGFAVRLTFWFSDGEQRWGLTNTYWKPNANNDMIRYSVAYPLKVLCYEP